jgi:hypothetical protein
MKKIIDCADSLAQKLSPVRQNLEAVLEALQPCFKRISAIEEERVRIAKLIDSEEESFAEKIDQLPKIDPRILLAHLLIEKMAEKKTGKKCKNAGEVWHEFFSKHENSLDLFERKILNEYLPYTFFFDHFSKWKNIRNRTGLEARNMLVHEIDGHESMKDSVSYHLFYADSNPSLSDLEKTYNLIKNL